MTQARAGPDHHPLRTALLAALLALPALQVPFLSDDWVHLEAVRSGVTGPTPMGYFRPLTMASFWFDLRAHGMAPGWFHLTNLLLISGAAFLVVLLVRRYTRDATLAAFTGALFALHPYHVQNAAWIAARADPLYSLFFLSAALTYDRWRERPRGLPVLALLLFQAALLAKETAIVLPVFLLAVGVLDRSRRPAPAEWLRGHLPVAGLGVAHFVLLRPLGLGEPGLAVLGGFGIDWLKRLLAFAVASLLPLQTEILEDQPLRWGMVALALGGALLAAARVRAGRLPRVVWGGAVGFLILLGPSLISFQERFLFLPSAASALVLAVLLRSCGRWARAVAMVLLVPGWLWAAADHWIGWNAAGQVSSRLIQDLVTASRRPGVHEVIVANMPHRVRGAPVASDFSAAVRLSGGRPVTVAPACYVDYPAAAADVLDGPLEVPAGGPAGYAEVRLRVPEGVYSRYVHPRPAARQGSVEGSCASITFQGAGEIRVRIPAAPDRGRAAYAWRPGGLVRLF